MNNIGSSLDRTLQDRAKNLHENSKVLSKQEKDVAKATEALRKENDKLGKVAVEGSKKVKELGNVQNWAEMLERDFLVLGEFVRLVDGGSEDGSEGSWTESEEESENDDHGMDGLQHEAQEYIFRPDRDEDASGDVAIDQDILEHSNTGPKTSEHPATSALMPWDATTGVNQTAAQNGKGKAPKVDANGDAEMWEMPQNEADGTSETPTVAASRPTNQNPSLP